MRLLFFFFKFWKLRKIYNLKWKIKKKPQSKKTKQEMELKKGEGVTDFILMETISEDAILDNVRDRLKKENVYVREIDHFFLK